MMKFGFGAVPAHSLEDAVRLAQLGESLGFDMVWMPDQTFYRDPFLTLAACAQATDHIRLMLGVTNPFTRHPVQIARAAATLDEIADGRLSLGYGAGNRKQLIEPLGQEQVGSGERCREAVIITKRLLAGEKVSHRSESLILENVELLIPPRPELPVYLAGRGPSILKAAGEVADGVIVGGLVSQAGLAYARRQITLGMGARNASLSEPDTIGWVSCHLTDELQEIIEHLKPNVAHIIGGAPRRVLLEIGLPDQRIDDLKRAYEQRGPSGSASLITTEEVELLSIVGDAEACSASLQRFVQAGFQQVGFLLTQPTPRDQQAFLRRFAHEVMPNFR